MISRIRTALPAAMLLLLGGCLPVPDAQWQRVPLNQKDETDKNYIIVAGDWIRTPAPGGGAYMLKVSKTDNQGLFGVARDNGTYRLNYADLHSIEVLRVGVGELPVLPLFGAVGGPGMIHSGSSSGTGSLPIGN